MVQEQRLKNWAFFCTWGHIGPEVPTRCASAEGNYESDEWDGEEPIYEPDMILPSISRRVLKARYIQYPYNLTHTVAQKLQMSTSRFEAELSTAKRRLHEQLSRAGVNGVA
jgi:hemolysin-activating ACP:hemolysin acyltransferase